MTIGQILFFGGIAAMVIFIFAAIAAWTVFEKKKKRLLSEIKEEF